MYEQDKLRQKPIKQYIKQIQSPGRARKVADLQTNMGRNAQRKVFRGRLECNGTIIIEHFYLSIYLSI